MQQRNAGDNGTKQEINGHQKNRNVDDFLEAFEKNCTDD
jgi:hypothetical protein